MLNQVGAHLGEVPLSRVKDISVTPGRSWQPIVITLDGGETIELEGRGAAHVIESAFKQHQTG